MAIAAGAVPVAGRMATSFDGTTPLAKADSFALREYLSASLVEGFDVPVVFAPVDELKDRHFDPLESLDV